MFADREDGGKELAQALREYQNMNVLVLGIPRGGAETAYYVATLLNAEFSLVVTRKLGYPTQPEAAFGAIAEDGTIYLAEEARYNLSEEQINDVINAQKQEIKRRVKILRHGKQLPKIENRTVIIVDDGIATGATLLATIELCKKKKARKIIVAAPTAGEEIVRKLYKLVDDVVVLETPLFYTAVSQGYASFENLTDQQALAFMDRWEKEHPIQQYEV